MLGLYISPFYMRKMAPRISFTKASALHWIRPVARLLMPVILSTIMKISLLMLNMEMPLLVGDSSEAKVK